MPLSTPERRSSSCRCPWAISPAPSATFCWRNRIRQSLLDLADDPTPAQVKALTGGGGLLRVRVGAWRVIYRVEYDQARVVIVDIGHRSSTVYRHL